MGRTESLNLKNDYERACGWYGHFNKSEMALFSECTDRYVQKLLDTADIVREAMLQQRFGATIPHHVANSRIRSRSGRTDANDSGRRTERYPSLCKVQK